MGPSHYLPFRGASLTTYSAFETPFGNVPVDTECKYLSVSFQSEMYFQGGSTSSTGA